MLIKEKEYKDLQEKLEREEKRHNEEIKVLNSRIKELEKSLKPDHIKVEFLEYLENPYCNPERYGRDFILGKFQVEANIKLSYGIVRQIHSMLNSIKNNLAEKYAKRYQYVAEDLKEKMNAQIKAQRRMLVSELLDIINNNFFIEKKLIEKLNQYNEY